MKRRILILTLVFVGSGAILLMLVRTPEPSWESSFVHCVARCDLECVMTLVDKLFEDGGPLLLRPLDKRWGQLEGFCSPAIILASCGADAVSLVLKNGGSITQPDPCNNLTIASLGARLNDIDLVNLYVEHGGELFFTTGYNSPLAIAIRHQSYDVALRLFELGTPPDFIVNELNGWTPLHAVCARVLGGTLPCRGSELFDYLLSAGANLDAVDRSGRVPLMYAVEDGCVDRVRSLIEQGADINKVDDMGQNVLFYLSHTSDVQVFEILINSGLDPQSQDKDGLRPVHRAVGWANADIVMRMLRHESVDILDDDILSPWGRWMRVADVIERRDDLDLHAVIKMLSQSRD